MHNYIKINGISTSPLYCSIVLDCINTMTDRLIRSSKTIVRIANLINQNPKISVRHASISIDPSYKKALKFYNKNNGETIYPSVLTITVPMDEKSTIDWIRSTGIEHKTSFGSSTSRFCTWLQSINESTTKCRLAIGYEDDYEKLCIALKDLIQMIDYNL